MATFDQLTAMKIFVAIVHEGSFTAAADKLGLTPPSVTKTIQKLEEHLQTALLVRTTRRVGLTDAGYTFLNAATEVIAQVEAVETRLREGGDELVGRLRVTAPMSLGRRVLSPWMVDFAKSHPKLEIEWILTDRVVDPIEENFDLALRTAYRLDNSPLFSQRVAEINRVIVGRPDLVGDQCHELKDLESIPAVIFLRERPQVHWRFVRDGRFENVAVKGTYRTNNVHAVLDAVRSGLGIANLPEYVVHDDLQSGELISLFPEYQPMRHTLFALYRQRLEQSRKVAALMNHLQEHLDGRNVI